MKKPQRTFRKIIFLTVALSCLVLWGCPKAKQTPSDETKMETSETAPAPPRTTPGTPAPAKGPVASELTLLNLAVQKDAQMIQTRLSVLGLYKGPIDGIWGKGSAAGLKAFKEKNALADPDKWDRETQVLLFSETDQASQPSKDTLQESISSGEVLLNPDIPKDARILQTRLAELGLYKGPIDGIWGKGSRAALRAFKEQNSLASPDKWDKETQLYLFHK
jgi:peptidoglycan hydrolase-like protein with peptidoglycan-binding domain